MANLNVFVCSEDNLTLELESFRNLVLCSKIPLSEQSFEMISEDLFFLVALKIAFLIFRRKLKVFNSCKLRKCTSFPSDANLMAYSMLQIGKTGFPSGTITKCFTALLKGICHEMSIEIELG